MFRTRRPLRIVCRYAGNMRSFMQYFFANFLNHCAFVLCATLIQRNGGWIRLGTKTVAASDAALIRDQVAVFKALARHAFVSHVGLPAIPAPVVPPGTLPAR
jgi:hypothetical protein